MSNVKKSNVKKIRELTAEELDIVAGGAGFAQSFTNEGVKDSLAGPGTEFMSDLKGWAKK
jgi:hypothetical protein